MSEEIPLTPDDVAEIVALLDGSGYDRLDIRTKRFALKVAREGGDWTQEWDHGPSPFVAGGVAAPVAPLEGDAGVDEQAVRAALPGTFYRAPQPGAPSFVEIGDTVEPDTVVGIIETMKLMNPVHAGLSGRIESIQVENATAIDAGTVLMRVAP